MARPHTTYNARCYACGQTLEVSVRAQSARCPACAKGLNLPDIIIRRGASLMAGGAGAGRTQTCGTVQVRRKARLRASLVEAGAGVQVLGELIADVATAGPMHIGPYGRFKGACRASALIVDLGARIEGGYFNIAGASTTSGASPADDTDQTSGALAPTP